MIARFINIFFIGYVLEIRDIGVNKVQKNFDVLENRIDFLFAGGKKPIKFVNMPIIKTSKKFDDFLRWWQIMDGNRNIFFQNLKILSI